MPEGVIYADLRFARSPPEKGHQEEPGEGELTYENVQGAQAQEEKGVCGSLKNAQVLPLWATARHCWSPVANRQTLGALAVFLFLLATNIGVGIRYLQASQQLQQASRDHTAKHHVLGEELYALQVGREESQQLLHRAQGELNSTVAALGESAAALGECWVAANRTHQQLRRQEQSLSQANLSLAVLQVERRSLEANLSQATSCRQIGCCPPGWTLFRWKCLWVSTQRKSWQGSAEHCKWLSSQLLVLKPWSAEELCEAVGEACAKSQWRPFWVGLRFESRKWTWVDGSTYTGSKPPQYRGYQFAAMHDGELHEMGSSLRYHFICEKAASPEEQEIEPREGELTYENIQGAQAQEEIPRAPKGAKGCSDLRVSPSEWSRRTRYTALGMLGIKLSLLTVMISLGVQYLQALQQLQQASQDHTAEHHVLGEELHALQVSREESQQLLHRAQGELNSTVAALGESAVALGECWVAANRTHQQLRRQEQSLSQANLSLAVLRVERRSLEAHLSQATSCWQIGCCPQGWKLFRWKCLWTSLAEAWWEKSKEDCRGLSSQLLILKKPWDPADVWDAGSPEQSNHYWVGLKVSQDGFLWVDGTSNTEEHSVWTGNRYQEACIDLHEGTLNFYSCYNWKKYICEKPASPWRVDGRP